VDDITISKAITQSFTNEFINYLDVDVAIAGAGPSGLTAGYYLARKGIKTVIYERKLSIGGGMWGGGMMFNRIVVQDEARPILDEMGVATVEYEPGYYVADSIEAVSALGYQCVKAGARIFNSVSVEDVMIREDDRVAGLVLNWSAVTIANLHVDPLSIRSRFVIDATGHDAEVCRIVVRKIGARLNTSSGEVLGEKPMWAEHGERDLVAKVGEVYPGLLASGMAVNAVYGYPRMGPIFGGMLISGKQVAELTTELLK
jgi:thiazole biosynthesis enzyme